MTVGAAQHDRQAHSHRVHETIGTDAKEQVRARLPLEDVVGEVVALKPAGGGRLKGLCPFHAERTPSFMVTLSTGRYHCYGCSADGDLFEFVQQTQNLDFRGALELLAARAGVELPAFTGEKKNSKTALELNDAAQAWFVVQLQDSEKANLYLAGRGILPDTIKAWGLGLAPDGWTTLTDHFTRGGTPRTALVEAGLAKDKGGRVYDTFRNRITIPIRDAYGRIVGFSGRTLGDDPAKYLNTPETAVFKKGDLLFGLPEARGKIRDSGAAIIVEGHLDVIALHQAGFTAAVGAQSATLTTAQIEALQRLGVTRLYLAFDNDEAGERATAVACEAVARRMVVRVVKLSAKDPAEVVQHDPALFRRALDEALDEAQFQFCYAAKGLDLQTLDGRSKLLQSLKPVLGDFGLPSSGLELRRIVAKAIGGDVTTADLKAYAEGKAATIDAHQAQAMDADVRRQIVRDRVAGEIPAFPLEALPKPLREYVEVTARALPVPPDFVAAPMLAALAAAIGNSREIAIKSGWSEGSRLYVSIVGDPGSRKTAALSKANDPLVELQRHWKKIYDQETLNYERQLEIYENTRPKRRENATSDPEHPGERPALRRILTTDATMEALVSLHTRNPRALLYAPDELAAWATGMNQYKGGRGNDVQKWLSAYSGDPIVIDRKGQEPEMIANPCISVSGGIQPDILPALQTAQGADGFIDRILFAYPKAVPKNAGFSFDDALDDHYVATYRKIMGVLLRLEQVQTANGPVPKPLQMTDEAKVLFKAWMDAHDAEKDEPGIDRRLSGVFGKYNGLFARFALILHLAAFAAGEEKEETISLTSVSRAAAVADYFKMHARRVHRQLGNDPEDKILGAIYDYIEQQPQRRCTVRTLTRAGLAGCKTSNAVRGHLRKLADAELGAFETIKTAGGQSSDIFVLTSQ